MPRQPRSPSPISSAPTTPFPKASRRRQARRRCLPGRRQRDLAVFNQWRHVEPGRRRHADASTVITGNRFGALRAGNELHRSGKPRLCRLGRQPGQTRQHRQQHVRRVHEPLQCERRRLGRHRQAGANLGRRRGTTASVADRGLQRQQRDHTDLHRRLGVRQLLPGRESDCNGRHCHYRCERKRNVAVFDQCGHIMEQPDADAVEDQRALAFGRRPDSLRAEEQHRRHRHTDGLRLGRQRRHARHVGQRHAIRRQRIQRHGLDRGLHRQHGADSRQAERRARRGQRKRGWPFHDRGVAPRQSGLRGCGRQDGPERHCHLWRRRPRRLAMAQWRHVDGPAERIPQLRVLVARRRPDPLQARRQFAAQLKQLRHLDVRGMGRNHRCREYVK